MTCKSLGRSLHKLLLVLLFCINLFLFSNTIQTFLKQLFWWITTWTRGQNTPWCKDIARSEHKPRQKMKTKRSSRKRKHSLNYKSEKLSVLGKWKEGNFSKRNLLGSNHLLQQTKLKTKTTDSPRKTHSAWSNKNIVCWKVTWFLTIKKGCLGESPSFDACTSWIFLGVYGNPQAWGFVHSSTHLIILQSLHLKSSFIQNSTQLY
jgi:hypothetical protein